MLIVFCTISFCFTRFTCNIGTFLNTWNVRSRKFAAGDCFISPIKSKGEQHKWWNIYGRCSRTTNWLVNVSQFVNSNVEYGALYVYNVLSRWGGNISLSGSLSLYFLSIWVILRSGNGVGILDPRRPGSDPTWPASLTPNRSGGSEPGRIKMTRNRKWVGFFFFF